MSTLNLQIAAIDDDPTMCEMIRDMLSSKFPGTEVQTFNTGEDALAALGMAPDLVILDYQLDSVKADAMNGIQVLAKLRERYPVTPVIFLSSQDRMEVATNTIKYGARDYIVKNETAFQKLELAIRSVLSYAELKKSHGFQKTMSTVVWVLLFLMIAYMIYLRFS